MWKTLEFWNFIIAVVALLVALYSIWYTRQRDRTTLEVVETWYETLEENLFFISFTLFNNSSTAVRITNIQLLNTDDTPVSFLKNFEYVPTSEEDDWARRVFMLDPYYENSPFDQEEIIPANADTYFRYYLKKFSPHMKIRITADRPINRWSKTKTVLVHFVQSN